MNELAEQLRRTDPECEHTEYTVALMNKGADEIDRLKAIERRFKAMWPLFIEARDTLPAISSMSARLNKVDLTLADRMDDVGVLERWEKIDAKQVGVEA